MPPSDEDFWATEVEQILPLVTSYPEGNLIWKSCKSKINIILLYFSDVKEVFDLFDFWDGRDGLVDGAKIGDLLRCSGLSPSNKTVTDNGGTSKLGL